MASDHRLKNYARSASAEQLVSGMDFPSREDIARRLAGQWPPPRPVVREGDTLTIDGIYPVTPNPAWRWWAFWRPRYVMSSTLQTFRVIDCAPGDRP